MKQNKISKAGEKYITTDIEYQETTITEISDHGDAWEIATNIGIMAVTKKNTDYVPAIGMTVRFYGKGMGYPVRGVTIVDPNKTIVFFYATPQEEEKEHQAWVKAEEKKEKERYEKEKPKFAKIYQSIPSVFQKRIDNFKKNNKDFGWKFEAYELFCIQEALIIANKLKTIEQIDNFRQMAWDAQRMLVPISDGHSGNTFGCAVVLAKTYLTKPEDVVKVHGSMCGLVGCKDYGCL